MEIACQASKLRVPSGAAWKVELTKCGGKIWFENGWLEFSNHYSLELGHLLVFRYDGNSNFHVIIFDRTASEIQYPYTSNNQKQSNEIPKQNINESKTECNGKSGFLAQQVSHNGCPAVKGDKRTNHPVIQRMKGREKVKALEKAINTFKSKNPFFPGSRSKG
ncbi:B3 domain-containing transcription factor VRN1 [Gossypium raimondii]|uniref:B3 domain-containing transcription factor VRN1 n=1 Tax=Gossypium raimondii TaxID=29730 RepID=UPI00063AA546|nr:B3 domain-containing transcription factor VRN1 [Gossypium raimondii]